MPKRDIYWPRITFEVEPSVYNALNSILPHGFRSVIFRKITEDLITLLQDPKNRDLLVGAYLIGELDLKDVLSPFRSETNGGLGKPKEVCDGDD